MVKTNLESTVEDFKAVVARNCDTPAHLQRLIYKGRILKDDQTLQSYGILFVLILSIEFEILVGFVRN